MLDLSMVTNMIGLRLNTTCLHCAAVAIVRCSIEVAAGERAEIMKRLMDSEVNYGLVDDHGMSLLYYRSRTYRSE